MKEGYTRQSDTKESKKTTLSTRTYESMSEASAARAPKSSTIVKFQNDGKEGHESVLRHQ
jgi:hypothetical protein